MNARGFTLVEVMVALTIFALVSASMMGAFLQQSRFNTLSEQKTEAIAAAQLVMDEIRVMDPASLPGSGSWEPEEIEIGDRVYQVRASFCERAELCLSNSIRHVTVSVEHNGRPMFEVETVYAQLR